MEKITKNHPLCKSEDILETNIDTLKKLFPTIVKEGKIDMKELEALLRDEVESDEEYYRFTWAGKSNARREANKPSTATLRPVKEESKNWDTTENVFIEGDNLEVLKLLQKSYANQIKMIYIDPPYNTGKDFVYKDNYADNLSNYLSITGQIDEKGKKTSTNTESQGRYHSNWLNMMYPRLKLARNLLKEDGVIFISIDDNEVHNLRKICDEIYGEDNLLIEIAWRKSDNQANIGQVARVKEYIVCYAKNKERSILNKIPLTEKAIKEYRYKDDRGNFRRDILLHKTRGRHEYEVTTKAGNKLNGPWMIKEEEFKKLDEEGLIYWTSGGEEQPYGKIYLEDSTGQIVNDFWGTEYGSNQQASIELEELLDLRVFDFPKSTTLLKTLTHLGSTKTDIILDFFAGSGTTSHSVMKLNSEDGGFRKCISVQLPQITEENSEAFKANYKTIAEITKERIHRAGEKIKKELESIIAEEKAKKEKELNLEDEGEKRISNEQILQKFDIGFKAFKLDTSNINSWDGSLESFEQNLLNSETNIKIDRTEEDVLFEVLLKYGLNLTVPIEEKTIAGCKVYSVGLGALFVCLADSITTEVADGIGKWKEQLNPTSCRVLFKDNGFKDDVAKTNSIQILKRFSISEINSL
jgi:adenine-specific DNA-methyltransferase